MSMYLEPLRSFRVYAGSDSGTLHSIYRPRLWRDAESPLAECLPVTYVFWRPGDHGVHAAPDLSCNCGWHAYHSPLLADPRVTRRKDAVYAVVECYGEIILGDNGLRAQRMRVLALSVERMQSGWQPRHVRVPTYPSLGEMLSAHPLTPIDDVRGMA